ncbi:MAG: hypothetical protein WBC91_10645 [Phototrophicaceae bacterium]
MNFDFGSGTNRTYNIASIGFVVAALLTCIITLLVVLLGGGGSPVAQALPTQLSLPTATETAMPTVTRTSLPATFTPTYTATSTIQSTVTASPTFTTSPTLSPTPTITTTVLPSDTPTATFTPLPTLGTPPPSPSPFLFGLREDPTFVSNLNASGCAWQGIGGQVLDLAGNASATQLVISVTGGGLPQALTTANNTNSLYGQGGYEVQLSNSINTQTYFVQLVSQFGTPVSEVIQVTFPGTCEGNAALLTFQQTRAN